MRDAPSDAHYYSPIIVTDNDHFILIINNAVGHRRGYPLPCFLPFSRITPSSRYKLLDTFTTFLTSPTMADDKPSAIKTTWTPFIGQIYVTDRRPVNGSYDYRAVEKKARQVMKGNHGAY